MTERHGSEDQRRFERVDFYCKLEVAAIPGGTPQPARSVDLSMGGVGIATPAVLPVGQLVLVTFFLKDPGRGEISDQVLGHVARFASDAEGNMIGVQFLQPLAEAQHERLVGKLLSR